MASVAKWYPLGAAGLSGALVYLGTGLHPLPALTWLALLPVLLIAPRVRLPWALGAAVVSTFRRPRPRRDGERAEPVRAYAEQWS